MGFMKKIGFFTMIFWTAAFFLSGCNNGIDNTLPQHPAILEWQDGPELGDDDIPIGGIAISKLKYQDRIYTTYADIKGIISGREIGECIGYTNAVNASDPDAAIHPEDADRVYLIKNDPDCNYLYLDTNSGLMDEKLFFRAEDTKWKKIQTFSFMDASCTTYYWGNS